MTKFFKILLLLISYLVSFVIPKKRAIVLMYHSVGGFNSKHSINPEEFEKQLLFLKDRYRVCRLQDIVEWSKSTQKLKDCIVAITLDDGYKDNKNVMLPLLQKYNLPATIFLSSNLEKSEKMGNMERLNEADIKELAGSGLVSIEAHSHNHKNLTLLPLEEARKEILESKDIIAKIAGRDPKYFAYPFGHRNAFVQEIVMQNFEAGFGIGEGRIKQGDNLSALKRVQVDRSVTFLEFKLRLTGALDVNRRVVDFFRKIFSHGK